VWIVRGLISACDCLSYENRLDHRLRGERVYILCRRPCGAGGVRGDRGSHRIYGSEYMDQRGVGL